MSQWNKGPKTFYANEDLAKDRRVKLLSADPTRVEYADADEGAVGFTLKAASSGDEVAIDLTNTGGTFKGTASEAIAIGATCYGAADGKVTDTDGGSYTGRFLALEAATADGSKLELLPITAY